MENETEIYNGPTSWNKDAGARWHRDCPEEPNSQVTETRIGLRCQCGATWKAKKENKT